MLNERIYEARVKAGMTQGAVADAVGKTRGAVSQWESGEVRPRHSTLKKLASVLSVTIQWLESGVNSNAVGLWVIGTVAAGLWREADMGFERYHLPVAPHPDYPAGAQALYRVEGDSVNKSAQNGDIIHVVDVIEAGIAPTSGDMVLVRRDRAGLSEYTAKRYFKENGVEVLRPDSDHPAWQEAIEINGDADTQITVIGIVIAKWSPIQRL